jgi:DNA-binding NarL/FixJ family response regulator
MPGIRVRVLLADDHAILLDSLRSLLQPAFEIVGAVTDGRALIQAAADLKPDVIVTDITMPGLNGLDAILRIRQHLPGARIIVLTVDEDPDTAAEALRRGAAGYVVKSAAARELFQALEQVTRGQRYIAAAITTEPAAVFMNRVDRRAQPSLSLREREVLQLLAEGRSMADAAGALGLTRRTVAFHKYGMMKKLGLRNSAELVRHAVALGLVDPKTPPDGPS